MLERVRRLGSAVRFLAAKSLENPAALPDLVRVLAGDPFDRPPIIIGGCGRSGTTLLVSVLSALPSILAIPYETEAFTPTLYSDRPDPEAPFYLWKLQWAIAERGLDDRTRRWCEKTPKNVVVFGRLLSHFEQGHLIHIVRDGRDVVTSRHPNDPTRYWVEPSRWVEDVRAGLRYRDRERVLTIRYEDLLQETAATFRELSDFLDEDLVSIGGDWTKQAAVQRYGRPSPRLVARPLDGSGVGRWQKPKHRERVRELLETPGARDLLSELGYT